MNTKFKYVAWENGRQYHRIKWTDYFRKFHWTICNKPIAFEEKWTTANRISMWNFKSVCDTCGFIEN